MATLAQKVRFLSDPQSYSHMLVTVEPLETHMSWVFLAGDLVYKFKKPTQLPFLDFTTLAARKRNCMEELRLNKRLSPQIYRRVVPMTEAANGELCIDGDGPVVEWLVEMKRLPSEATLDLQIAHGTVQHQDVVDVAERLAHFYQNNPPQIADGKLYLDHLTQEHAISRKILMRAEFGLADDATVAVIDAVEQKLNAARGEIEARIAQGLIVEGHGDLRPEHVYLGAPVQIIDCLEFDRTMRILDPYDEVNYLGMECQVLGADWIRPLLLETLNAHLGMSPSSELMEFYGSFRAVLRARICMAHLLDPDPMTPEIWPERTHMYLDLARAECLKFRSVEDDGSNHPRADA